MTYLNFWKKTFDFTGRDGKKAFWTPVLINWAAGILLAVVLKLTDSPLSLPIQLVWCVLTLLPTVSASARRLRDAGASLKFYWLLLIPGAGLLALMCILCYGTGEGGKKTIDPRRCPYCGGTLEGSVRVGSVQQQRVRQNRCPHCGRTLPNGMRVVFK